MKFDLTIVQVAEINELLQNQQPQSTSQSEGYQEASGDGLLYGDIFPRVPIWYPQDEVYQRSANIISFDEAVAGLPSSHQCDFLI